MLVNKIKAAFLTTTKAQLDIALMRIPMTITHNQSLALFQNMVNQKHPFKLAQLTFDLAGGKSTRQFQGSDAVVVDVAVEAVVMEEVVTVEIHVRCVLIVS